MKKNIFYFIVFLLFICISSFSITYTVDDDNPADFMTIQSAINASTSGDIINVQPGTYFEQITLIDGIKLIGSGPDLTTIDGTGHQTTVYYSGTDNAIISGFTITGAVMNTNPENLASGIYCYAGTISIFNNVIKGNKYGITINSDTSLPYITNNTIVDNEVNGITFTTQTPVPNFDFRIAYIYSDTITAANSFKSLLDTNNIVTDLIHISNVASTDFSPYRGIIIDHNTGTPSSWGVPAAVTQISMSGKPILGIGYGGGAFFRELGLSINSDNFQLDLGDSLFVSVPNHKIYNAPNKLTIPVSNVIGITSLSQNFYAFEESKLDFGVQKLGRHPGLANFYTIAKEGPHVSWGYTALPSDMTETGKELFINTVFDLGHTCYSSLEDPQIVIAGTETINGGTEREFHLKVLNWQRYPMEFFIPAPDLSPCNGNPNASRARVEIYDEANTLLETYCSLMSREDYRDGLSFTVPVNNLPEEVYIRVTDRRCLMSFTSASISIDSKPAYHTILNNIIANNGEYGVTFYSYAGGGQIMYNDLFGNTAGDYYDVLAAAPFTASPGSGEITVDPVFGSSDYRLELDSPCIDAGHPGPDYNDPDGTRNDMGAYGGPLSEMGYSNGDSFVGSGFLFTSVGDIPISEIVQDQTNLSHGLANVSPTVSQDLKIHPYQDSPFGGKLWLHGMFGSSDNDVIYYKFQAGKWDGDTPPDEDDFVDIQDQLSKLKLQITSTGEVIKNWTSLGPQSYDGEENLYMVTRATPKVWWSHIDLRMIWNTSLWNNGKYTLRYKAYRLSGTSLEEKILAPNTGDHFTLIVNNSQPEVIINHVKYDNGQVIPECGIINLANPIENLKFDISAWHENGYLDHVKLLVYYGKNRSGGYVVNDYYNTLHDSPPPLWQGYTNLEVEAFPSTPPVSMPAPNVDPWSTCAYRFRLFVSLRTTDGKKYIYDKEYNDHYYIDTGGNSTALKGDVNCDGLVNIVDALFIAQYDLGIISNLPCF